MKRVNIKATAERVFESAISAHSWGTPEFVECVRTVLDSMNGREHVLYDLPRELTSSEVAKVRAIVLKGLE